MDLLDFLMQRKAQVDEVSAVMTNGAGGVMKKEKSDVLRDVEMVLEALRNVIKANPG